MGGASGGAISNSAAPDRTRIGNGGGVVTMVGATTGIVQSTFEQNATAGNGGAIYNGGLFPIEQLSFSRNAPNNCFGVDGC